MMHRQILWLLVLVMSSIASSGSAYADVDFFRDESYIIPEERLPFQLLLNATHNGLQGNEVSIIQLELFENKTNQKIMNVSYFVTLTDLQNNERILNDLFYAQNGTVTFLLTHNPENEAPTRIENSHTEQYLNAWVADPSDKHKLTTIISPLIRENESYQLTLELFTVDDTLQIIAKDSAPKIDYVLDTSTDGSTRFTVVPEFPIGMSVLIIGMLAAVSYVTFTTRRQLQL